MVRPPLPTSFSYTHTMFINKPMKHPKWVQDKMQLTMLG